MKTFLEIKDAGIQFASNYGCDVDACIQSNSTNEMSLVASILLYYSNGIRTALAPIPTVNMK